jgi:riboflavin kinase/FMN adenylyltransferase
VSVPALAPEYLDRSAVSYGWPAAASFDRGSVVTIGVFDGFHRGHEALVNCAIGHSRRLALPSVLVTFSPHPLVVLAPGAAPRLLMPLEDRVDHALSLGIDAVVVLGFTPALAVQSAGDFVAAGLVGRLSARLLVVGSNFHCGRDGEGDVARLAELGRDHGLHVEGVDLVEASGHRCSSTEVRRAMARGDLARARDLLGRDDQRVLALR